MHLECTIELFIDQTITIITIQARKRGQYKPSLYSGTVYICGPNYVLHCRIAIFVSLDLTEQIPDKTTF